MVPDDQMPSEEDVPTVRGDEELPEVMSTLSIRLRSREAPQVELDSETAGGNGARANLPEDASNPRISKLASQTNTEARYVLKGELGRGGMGAVLKVFDNDLRRTLAMKVIRGQQGELSSVQSHTLARFLEEAQVTGQLDHPSVVPVHELGVDQAGRVYFTMPMIKGRELKEIIQLAQDGSDGWTLTKTLGIFLKICGALAYAHDKGVIHRDLKPANVMVGKYGQTYVMDWGLARVLGKQDTRDLRPRMDVGLSISEVRTDRKDRKDADTSDSPLMTMDGTVVGTPYYMPPEQAAGLLEAVDARSDIYAVGAMLYHLLTGRMPYSEPGKRLSPHAVLARVLQGPPTPIHELKSGVAPELVAICDKAMARESGQRYASTLNLEEDLRAFIESRVVSAYRTGPVIEFKNWVKRNRALAMTSAAAIVLMVGGSTTAALVFRGQNAEIQERKQEEANARIAAERQTYLANVTLGGVGLRDHKYDEAQRSLFACPEDLRNWEWRHLRLQLNPAEFAYQGVEGIVRDSALSPDGRLLAIASEVVVKAKRRGTVAIWDVSAGGEPIRRFTEFNSPVAFIAFDPDGAGGWITTESGSIRDWKVKAADTEIPLIFENEPDRQIIGLKRTASATLLVTTDKERSTLRIASLPRGAHVDVPGPGKKLTAFALDPTGTLLVTAWNDTDEADEDEALGVSHLLLSNAETGETIAQRDGLAQRLYSVAVLGDRVVAGSKGEVLDWHPVNNVIRTLSGRHRKSLPVRSVAFDPAGTRLASGSQDGSVLVWNARTDALQATLDGHLGGALRIAFTPDGQSMLTAAGGGSVRRFHAVTGSMPIVMARMGSEILSLCWSPDGGSLFAAKASDTRIHEFDGTTGEERPSYEGHRGELTSLAASPDGKFVVSGSTDRTLLVFEIETRQPVELAGRSDGPNWTVVTGVAYDPQGRWVASTGRDAVVQLWDPRTGTEVDKFANKDLAPFTQIAFTPDGSKLVWAAYDEVLRVWDLAAEKAVGTEGDGVDNAVDGRVRTLRYKEAREELEPGSSGTLHEAWLICLAMFPNGRQVVVGDLAGVARVWDIEDEVSFTLEGHEGFVSGVAVHPSGNRIATGDSLGTIRIWDAADGSLLATLLSHRGGVNALVFSPDGTRLASGGVDGTVRIWDSEPASALALWAGTSARAELSLERNELKARELIEQLFTEVLLRDEVVERLKAENLEPELLEYAVHLSSEYPGPTVEALATRVRQILRKPDATRGDLELAKRLAFEASRMNPDDTWLSLQYGNVLKRLSQ